MCRHYIPEKCRTGQTGYLCPVEEGGFDSILLPAPDRLVDPPTGDIRPILTEDGE